MKSVLKIRRRLKRLIDAYPGLHLRELARQAQLTEALAGYHLDQMVEAGLVLSESEGGFRCFYPAHAHALDAADRSLLSLLRQEIPFRVALLLLENKRASHGQLVDALDLTKQNTSYHLGNLTRVGLVEPVKGQGYGLREPERVERLLLAWEPPRSLHRFGRLWRSLYARRKQ